jgi:hypothetical protein
MLEIHDRLRAVLEMFIAESLETSISLRFFML